MDKSGMQVSSDKNSEADDLAEVVRARPNGDVPKERPCMYCGKKFHSEGWHNRLCSSCQRRGSGSF